MIEEKICYCYVTNWEKAFLVGVIVCWHIAQYNTPLSIQISLFTNLIIFYTILQWLLVGSDDRETLATMNNLAVLYNNSQNIECARSLYEDIVRIRKSVNPHGKETIESMITLGK